MRKSKLLRLIIASTLFFVVTLTSCDGGGLPDGRYTPTQEYEAVAKGVIQAIIINGDNFTVVYPLTGVGITYKYKYTDGTLSVYSSEGASAGLPCEFKEGVLYFAGIPFEKD